jgi:hypothetical protein
MLYYSSGPEGSSMTRDMSLVKNAIYAMMLLNYLKKKTPQLQAPV